MWISSCGINRLLTQCTNRNMGYLKPNTAAGKKTEQKMENLRYWKPRLVKCSLCCNGVKICSQHIQASSLYVLNIILTSRYLVLCPVPFTISYEPLSASPPAERLQLYLWLPAAGSKSDMGPRAVRGVYIQATLLWQILRFDYFRHTLKASSHSVLVSCGLVRLSPLGTSATNWPTVPAPDDRWWWWLWSNWWNENWQRKLKYSEKTCPSATLSTTNSTWPDLGSKPSRQRLTA
jgi:hypothetical protein